jgi:hypothetical protein
MRVTACSGVATGQQACHAEFLFLQQAAGKIAAMIFSSVVGPSRASAKVR